jgi:hypothetical protein
MADIELKTYGDLKNAINSISLKQKGDKIVSQGKSFALDQILGFFPGASNAKTLYDFIKAATLRPDNKKTKTWLDKLDIDDDVSAIVDDTVENGFLKYISDKIKSKNDNEDLEGDFNMNQELADYLSDKYNQRYVAGVPSSNINEMDKKTKIKEILKAKLKQEMSSTGTGASVTPGVGMGVATKYAFKKKVKEDAPRLAAGKVKDNYAVSHFGFKNAPSVPNRKSKAMDYKELWEDFKVGDKVKYENQEWEIISFLDNGTVRLKHLKGLPSTNVIPSNIEKLKEGELKLGVKYNYKGESGFISTGGSQDPKDWKFLGDKGKYPYLAVKADLVPSETQPTKYGDSFSLGMGKGHHIDENTYESLAGMLAQLGAEEDAVKVLVKAVEMGALKPTDAIEIVKKTVNLNEGYAQFRNATKQRSKPDQFHQAVKQVKQKMNEINRIFEYVDRLKSELSEGEDLKYKKYTENAFTQIKESAKQLFLKSTKLK